MKKRAPDISTLESELDIENIICDNDFFNSLIDIVM